MRFVLEGVYLSLFSSFLRVPPKLRAATRGCCAFLYVEAQDQTHTVRRDGTRCTDPGSKYARVCAQSTLRWPRNRRWQPGISGRWIPEPGAALPEIKWVRLYLAIPQPLSFWHQSLAYFSKAFRSMFHPDVVLPHILEITPYIFCSMHNSQGPLKAASRQC